MARPIVEAGRMEVRGAVVRFKQRGTLVAFDRNLAALISVRARATPVPAARLFVDFEFPESVFRCWQDSTLINYKEFLEKVEFSGIENFRAMLRYTTKALGDSDPATSEFVAGKPPERFFSKEELAEYDAAVGGGGAPPSAPVDRAPSPISAGATPSPALPVADAEPAPPASDLDKKKIADEAWKTFATDIAQVRAERPKKEPPLAGFIVSTIGLALLVVSFACFLMSSHWPENTPNVMPLIAGGMVLGLAFIALGIFYLSKARHEARVGD